MGKLRPSSERFKRSTTDGRSHGHGYYFAMRRIEDENENEDEKDGERHAYPLTPL